MDYKKTLLLPETDFPMRGNLGVNEINIQQKWEDIDLYQKVLEKNQKNEDFCLHDGPPYANGNIHIGHALNKILKDFIIRFKTMKGFKTSYIPGWDTHGLPIEVAVSKINKNVNNDVSRKYFIQKCTEFAHFYIEKQKKQFQRLGILGYWKDPYLTLDKIFVSEQIKIFAELVSKKLVFKDLKPVYFSPTLSSVLSECEIEYYEVKTNSIYVNFLIDKSNSSNINDSFLNDLHFIIWTTTPWTLPANVAIAVNPKSLYKIIQINNKKYLIGAKNLIFLKKIFNWDEEKINYIADIKGSDLEGLKYYNPIVDRKGQIILDENVLDNEGTGLVHMAPGHGMEDYLACKKYNLPIICCVNQKGFMNELASKYKDSYYQKSNFLIIEELKKIGCLIKEREIVHSYPHDNRTKNPVIFLAIPQWFISIESIKKNLLSEVKKIHWLPKWGLTKMYNMIEQREDWAISRQRMWGVPIPIFYDENKTPILDEKIIKHISVLFRKNGLEIWYEWPVKDLLPLEYVNKNIEKIHLFTKETDIMDVWFDSGSSFSILKYRNQKFPADIYLEGGDQYRGWFNSSLIISTAVNGFAPYKKAINHGFVLDGKGHKMSKSLGNIIDPLKIIKQKGADVLRLWVATTDYNIDVRVNDYILKQTEEIYRKIRNTLRFMLGNLKKFVPNKHYILFQQRDPIHQVIMIKFNNVLKIILESYENFQFEKAVRSLHVFLNNEISAFYFGFAKDILYLEREDNTQRRMIQSNIYDILMDTLKVLTPIIPHTTSEAYNFLPFEKKYSDIYLEDFPVIKKIENVDDIEKAYDIFCYLKDIIFKKIEESIQNKVINSSLQAKIDIELSDKYLSALKLLKIDDNLKQLLIVSQVNLKGAAKDVHIEVMPALGNICPRCWNVIYDKNIDDLCDRCLKNIDSI